MHVKINLTGKASLCESALISHAMNMDIDNDSGLTPEGRQRVAFGYHYGNRGGTGPNSQFPTHSGTGGFGDLLTLNVPNVGSLDAQYLEDNPFPKSSSDGKYHVYLDGTTVKVDVRIKSHFAENDFVASFFIQYVLRAGASL